MFSQKAIPLLYRKYSRTTGEVKMKMWDFAEWLESCGSIPKITGSNPSGGSELTFRSDLLLTARGGST
jgi:hypothetical protein